MSLPTVRRLAFAIRCVVATASALVSWTNGRARAQPAPAIRPLSYTRITLANGLVALLNEDHSTPLVAVDVWYHIGSKDDKPGRAGLAHLCEHVMGAGSPH